MNLCSQLYYNMNLYANDCTNEFVVQFIHASLLINI